MRQLIIGFILLFAFSPANAGVITSLALQVGQNVSVTVVDTDHSNAPVNPASISWSPLGTPSIATGSTNTAGTGFNLLGTAPGSVTATVTYTAPTGVTPATVTATLPITVTAPPITHIGFTSP
jgi:hypothetical protein